MDKDTSYAAKFIVKCLLYFERQLRKRRHKLSMANLDESLHQTATNSTTFEKSSNNGSYVMGVESIGQNETSVGNERGIICNENKVFNGPEGGRPKKSLFEITSVESTSNRGESGGIEDGELDETLTDIQEISSPLADKLEVFNEFTGEETARDKSASANSNGSEVSQTHTSGVGLTSRFKIVKVARAEPYRRGRWSCQEFMDTSSENKASDRSVSESRVTQTQETRDQTKQDKRDNETKLLLYPGPNGNDSQNFVNNSSELTSETRGGAVASDESFIESLQSEAASLANFMEG